MNVRTITYQLTRGSNVRIIPFMQDYVARPGRSKVTDWYCVYYMHIYLHLTPTSLPLPLTSGYPICLALTYYCLLLPCHNVSRN